MLLALPAVDAAIPAVIEFDTHAPGTASMALAMHGSGLIDADDLAPLDASDLSSAAVRGLVERGWRRSFADEYQFSVLSAICTVGLPKGTERHPFFSGDGYDVPCCVVAINSAAPEAITIGPTILALEALQMGLGRTALDIINDGLASFGVPYTPRGAFWMAQFLYWRGSEDETDVYEEYKSMEENPDDLDIPKRAEVFEGIPEWAYAGGGKDQPKRLSKKRFAKAVKRFSAHELGPLLSVLATLQGLNEHPSLLLPPPDEYECPEPPVLLYWSKDDQLQRVFDDHYQCQMEGETAPYLRGMDVAINEKGISDVLPLVRHTGKVLKTIDDALVEIGKLENEL